MPLCNTHKHMHPRSQHAGAGCWWRHRCLAKTLRCPHEACRPHASSCSCWRRRCFAAACFAARRSAPSCWHTCLCARQSPRWQSVPQYHTARQALQVGGQNQERDGSAKWCRSSAAAPLHKPALPSPAQQAAAALPRRRPPAASHIGAAQEGAAARRRRPGLHLLPALLHCWQGLVLPQQRSQVCCRLLQLLQR